MSQRLLELKDALQGMVVCAEWIAWAAKQKSAMLKTKIVKVKDILLGVAFWASLESMVELFQPVVKLLRLTDSELPSISKIHDLTASCSICSR